MISQIADAETMLSDRITKSTTDTTVLIVDDSAIDRRIAGRLVEKVPGLKAAYACDGDEALAAIEREEPAVVLTDLQMPALDGLGLVDAIRRRHPHVPVVLMTAYGSEEVAMQALRAGAANYVPKKALALDLATTLKQVLAVSAVENRRKRLLGSLDQRESRFQLVNDPALIAPLIELLQEDLGAMGLGDETVRTQVGVALQEALANALYHGNLEVSSDLRQDDEREFYQLAECRRTVEPYQSRRIHVAARFDRDHASYTIHDEGPGFDTTALERPIEPDAVMRVGGRGMLLIRLFMDEVSHNERGNEIRMLKLRKNPSHVDRTPHLHARYLPA